VEGTTAPSYKPGPRGWTLSGHSSGENLEEKCKKTKYGSNNSGTVETSTGRNLHFGTEKRKGEGLGLNGYADLKKGRDLNLRAAESALYP